jgi:DNA polymerase-3 subunit gamma/tau
MLEIVEELVRNGHHLQHFVRELARYFRNLLVSKIGGVDNKLVAASRQERERLAAIAARFSQQDLTRYLQLTLDLFKDLQTSLQQRLHLELGLIRLVEAGKLVSIEEALAGAAGSAPPRATPAPASGGVRPAPPPAAAGLRERLAASLREQNQKFTADAIAQSEIVESDGELRITAPEEFRMALRERDIDAGLKTLGERRKVKIAFTSAAPQSSPVPKPTAAAEDEAMQRALADPEVQRFREAFPGSVVRVARNLKE